MTTLVVLIRAEKAKPLIRWAARFARAQSNSLTVLCCVTSASAQPPVPVSVEQSESGEALLRAAGDAVAELGSNNVELLELRHPDPVKAALKQLKAQDVELLVVGADSQLPPRAPEARLGDRLLRFAPCNTLLIDPGGTDGRRCERVLVPMGVVLKETELDVYALQAATGLVTETGVVLPLMVGSEKGGDAEEVARRELELELREADIAPSETVKPTVVLTERPLEGVAQASRGCDLLLMGATSPRLLRPFRTAQAASGAASTGAEPAVGFIRPAKFVSLRHWSGVTERVLGWLPELKPTDRVDAFDRLQAGARANVDFLVMIGLSTAIASLGLLQNSTAVVIGAMLVAPLMTPLIGAGFSLVQGNTRLFRRSLQAMAVGVLTGLLLSVLIGLITPAEELTQELMARTTPDLMDLLVAFLSGMAAAYAFARPSVMGVLAGVAIAAALVPPLAAAGIALARWQLFIAQGAAILHLTNLVAIILGSALVFRLLGVRGTRLGIGPALWARRTVMGLSLVAVLLIAPLGYQSAEKLAVGQTRAIGYPLPLRLDQAITDRVNREPDIEVILTGRPAIDIKGAPNVGIVLSAAKPVPAPLLEELKQLVYDVRGEGARVAVWALQVAPVKPADGEENIPETTAVKPASEAVNK